MFSIGEQFPDTIQNEVGDALRLVATYDNQKYQFEHLRKDLLEDYTFGELEKALDQLEIEGMGLAYFERYFHLGELDSMIYGFDDALIFQFPYDDFKGLIVSIERDVELNPESIISTCWEAMPPRES